MIFGPGGYENYWLRMGAQELGVRHGITEIASSQRMREMEAGHRYSLFYQDPEFQACVR